MYICNRDFNLYVGGKCFSFSKGEPFWFDDIVSVKSLLEKKYIVRYNYSKPAIKFTEVGIVFFEPEMENK